MIKQLNLDVEVWEAVREWISLSNVIFASQLKNLDFDKNEHRSREFFQINPLHQVPTLDDNGFLVTDSHAIISYLARNSSLYSPDARIQARINQMLFFDFDLFRVMGEVGVSIQSYVMQKFWVPQVLSEFRQLIGILIVDRNFYIHSEFQ